jgi:hypothetical protein
MSVYTSTEQALSGRQQTGRVDSAETRESRRDEAAGKRQVIRRKVFSPREPGRNQRVIEHPPRES